MPEHFIIKSIVILIYILIESEAQMKTFTENEQQKYDKNYFASWMQIHFNNVDKDFRSSYQIQKKNKQIADIDYKIIFENMLSMLFHSYCCYWGEKL